MEYRIVRGTCHPLFVFEVGQAIDLDRSATGLGATSERQIFRQRGRPSPVFQYRPAPLRIPQEAPAMPVGEWATEAGVDVVLYDFGAASVAYRIPVAGDFAALLSLSLALRDREALRNDARTRVSAIIAKLGSAVSKPKVAEMWEDYTIYAVRGLEPHTNAAAVITGNEGEIAQILRSEPAPLSPEEISDATNLRISFGLDDTTVVDWDAALVLDPEPEDVQAVLEFANVQLIEMRYLDTLLDDAIERSYQLLSPRKLWSALRPAAVRADVQQVAELQLESAVLLERVTNALKFFGEEYLARIYRLATRRFQLQELDDSISRKLVTVESIYQKLADRATNLRMELLEWVIIILIVIEIVLSLRGH